MASKRQVPAERYDREYLLSDNTEGFQEFRDGGLSFIKQEQLEKLEIRPGILLLEVGFGRGEFLCHCAKRGAKVAGIDYSPAALEIATETMAEFPEADLRVADCRDLPFEDNSFERIYSGDVLEHINMEDGVVMLREMQRVLKPGGFLFIHTAPNTVFTRGVLPLAKPLLRAIDAKAVDTLEEHMKINESVHVHEYNLFSLRKVTRRAGLEGAEIWINSDILRSSKHRHTQTLSQNPLVRLVGKLGNVPAVRFLLGNDLYLKYRK